MSESEWQVSSSRRKKKNNANKEEPKSQKQPSSNPFKSNWDTHNKKPKAQKKKIKKPKSFIPFKEVDVSELVATEDGEELMKQLKMAFGEMRMTLLLDDDYVEPLKEKISTLLGEGIKASIYCWGIGSLVQRESRHRLLVSELIAESFSDGNFEVFDPKFISTDVAFIKEHVAQSPTVPSFNKCEIECTKKSIFIIPRPHKGMIEMLLASNWNKNLKNIVLFSQSLDEMTESHLPVENQKCPKLTEAATFAKEVTVADTYGVKNAFSGMVLIDFSNSKIE